VRRLLPVLILALLALPGGAAAAGPPKTSALASDAVAMKTLAQAAVKVERCAAKTLDYTRCDSPGELALPRGVLLDASTSTGYGLTARSRQGRRFRLDRSGESLTATCTPAGRGRCAPAGTWRPSPKPVRSRAWVEHWLAHERELVARVLSVVDMIERCHAATGDFGRCRTPEVEAAAAVWPNPLRIDLYEDSYYVAAISAASTEFLYQRSPDGTVHRDCRFLDLKLVSPCDGERW
jgi:hypothetical protein